eukprot:TCONS_00044154-protein
MKQFGFVLELRVSRSGKILNGFLLTKVNIREDCSPIEQNFPIQIQAPFCISMIFSKQLELHQTSSKAKVSIDSEQKKRLSSRKRNNMIDKILDFHLTPVSIYLTFNYKKQEDFIIKLCPVQTISIERNRRSNQSNQIERNRP